MCMRNYNILCSPSLLTLCQPGIRKAKESTKSRDLALSIASIPASSPVPVCWWMLVSSTRLTRRRNKQGYLWAQNEAPLLTSASTCCWVRLWSSLYWLALRTCCSMPSRTASQPSHLQRRQPALSCRKALEHSSSLHSLPPQCLRGLPVIPPLPGLLPLHYFQKTSISEHEQGVRGDRHGGCGWFQRRQL